jgi:hypothetical protein
MLNYNDSNISLNKKANNMTVKDLLVRTIWEDVWGALSRLFPEYTEYMSSYRCAYDELRRMKPEESNTRLLIGRYEPDGIIPFYVLGIKGDNPKCFSLKFSSWDKWLGASVDDLILSRYDPPEVIAICLYDMTWAGFSSEDVVTFHKEFIKNKESMLAIYSLIEDIEASEMNLVKQKQRSNEIYEAIGLYDFDIDYMIFKNESPEFTNARLDMEAQVYCLGETEIDYDTYCSKVAALRKRFQHEWPDAQNKRPFVN